MFPTLTCCSLSSLRVQVYVLSRRVELTFVLHASKFTCLEDHHRAQRLEDLPCQDYKIHLRMFKSSYMFTVLNDVKRK